MLFAFIWIALILPIALMLYHPAGRVNTILAPVLFGVPWTLITILVGSPVLILRQSSARMGLWPWRSTLPAARWSLWTVSSLGIEDSPGCSPLGRSRWLSIAVWN